MFDPPDRMFGCSSGLNVQGASREVNRKRPDLLFFEQLRLLVGNDILKDKLPSGRYDFLVGVVRANGRASCRAQGSQFALPEEMVMPSKRLFFHGSLVLSLLVSFLSPGMSIYVDQSVASPGDGGSWETAFKTIQEGMDAAETGDEVIVAAGTYIERLSFGGKSIVVRSVNPDEPGVVASTVIESGGLPEVVVFRGGEDRNAVVSGFTITAGQVGISCAWSSPVIRNNVIVSNSADYDEGGGISCYSSSPLIENNIIAANRAYLGGAGIACDGAQPVIVGNLLIGNVTDMNGGGILLANCSAIVSRNRIIANVAQGNGGGIFCRGSEGQIVNNLVVSNVANSMGGGIAIYSSSSSIVANTIANNRGQGAGAGGIQFLSSSGIVFNCILWGNGDDLANGQALFSCLEDDDPGEAGEGSIHDDPRFEDADGADDTAGTEDDDYRLSPDSPCLDKGCFAEATGLSIQKLESTFALSWDPGTDLAGQPRLTGDGPDMGCYESEGPAAVYRLESSSDFDGWTLVHESTGTEFLPPFSPERKSFFRVSLSPGEAR